MDPDDETEIRDPREQETMEHKQERKLKEAAREFLTSEKTFVEALRLLCIDFKDFVDNSKKQDIISPSEFQPIFRQLPNLLQFNEILLKDFENRIANWDANPKIADIIKTKGRFLLLYQTYVDEFEDLRNYFKRICEVNKSFKEAVTEFESLPKCQNLKLTFYMHKPVQRLLQYKILLESYLKYLPKDSIDFDDAVDALNVVTEVAEKVNESLRNQVPHKIVCPFSEDHNRNNRRASSSDCFIFNQDSMILSCSSRDECSSRTERWRRYLGS